jgi:hypothetical protein
MKNYTIVSIFIFAIMAACSTTKTTTTTSNNELANTDELALTYAKSRWSDVTKEQLEQGKFISENQCVKCHKQKPIPNYTEEHWDKAINKMAPKAKLTTEETTALKRYIFTQKGLENK